MGRVNDNDIINGRRQCSEDGKELHTLKQRFSIGREESWSEHFESGRDQLHDVYEQKKYI